MAHLGILLACEHFPAVSSSPEKLDPRLRGWLTELGHEVTEISVFDCYLGKLPKSVGDCNFWIVSGNPLGRDPTGLDLRGLILGFLRGVTASKRTVLALHHGEHLLHASLACPSSPAPTTNDTVRVYRNPFRNFWQSDDLFRFDTMRRAVLPAVRPVELQLAA